MRAELILGWCDVPLEGIDIQAAVDGLADDILADVYAAELGEPPLSHEEWEAENAGVRWTDWRIATRVRLMAAFANLEAAKSGESATMVVFDVHGYTVAIGGEASYGDLPLGAEDCYLIHASGIGQS